MKSSTPVLFAVALLLVWCSLACAGSDGSKLGPQGPQASGAQGGQGQGLQRRRREEQEPWDSPREEGVMADAQAERAADTPKPKVKKSPEEVLAAKAKKAAEKEAKAKKQKAPKPTKKPKPPKPTKKPKPPKPTKKPKPPKTTKKPKEKVTKQPTGAERPEKPPTKPSLEEEEERLLKELGWDKLTPTVSPKEAEEKPVYPEGPFYREPVEPTPPGAVTKKLKEDDPDYWDAKYELPESFPDRGALPTADWRQPVLGTTNPPYTMPWYEEYDYGEIAAKKLEEERERAKKEKEERAEKQRKMWEEEERAREKQIPVYKEPKSKTRALLSSADS